MPGWPAAAPECSRRPTAGGPGTRRAPRPSTSPSWRWRWPALPARLPSTWTEADHGLFGRALGLTALAVDPASPATIYAGTRGGVFKSTNAAVSWAPMNQGLADSDVQALAIGAHAHGTAVVLAGTSAAQPPSGVYRSVDGGAPPDPSDPRPPSRAPGGP